MSMTEPLAWAVKMSFRRYIQGAGGTVAVTAPAAEEGAFYVFPRATDSFADGEVRYLGAVRFAAHSGALDLLLADPGVHFQDGRVALTVADPEQSDERITLAWLSEMEDAVAAPGRREFWPALTEEGTRLFGGVYPTHALLDPVSFVPEWRG